MDADGRSVWWAEVDLGKTMFRAARASWEVILSVSIKFIIIHYYYKLETDFLFFLSDIIFLLKCLPVLYAVLQMSLGSEMLIIFNCNSTAPPPDVCSVRQQTFYFPDLWFCCSTLRLTGPV